MQGTSDVVERDGPLVSVVLPTRNRASLLRRAVATVAAQTWRELEILVVDDGSTDETSEVLAAISRQEDRLRVIRLERPGGAAAARNRAIAAAGGAYVAFQDDDCIWAANKIERLVQALEAAGPGVGFAYSAIESVELNGSRRVLGTTAPNDKYRGPCAIGTVAVVVRRAPLLRVGGFDESLPRLQDLDLWVRILAETDYVFIPQVLVRTIRVAGGISTCKGALSEAAAMLRKKYRGGGVLGRDDLHAMHLHVGGGLMVNGLWAAGLKQMFDAVRTRPTLFRSWLALFAAVGGPAVYRTAVRLRESARDGSHPVDAMIDDPS